MMLISYRFGAVCPLIFVAAAASGCGDPKSSNTPVAPTAVVVDQPQSSEAGADGEWGTTAGKPDKPGHGNGNNGGGNGNSNGKIDPPSTQTPQAPSNQTPQVPTNTTPTTTRKVEIEGVISAKSGDSITVNAQSVTIPTTCVIRHGDTQFVFSDLKVGDRVHVKGMRTTTGTGASATTSIEASEVKLQNPGSNETQ